MAFIQNSCGATPGPQDCFLVLRGLKTLHLRMQRHCENGKVIAEWLAKHPKVDKVYWPGFPTHPNHAVADDQMRDFGGMMSFTLKGDNMADATKIPDHHQALHLGRKSWVGWNRLLGHPPSMTHASIPREERLKNGLADTLIRLSVGLEDAEDLIADLEQALRLIVLWSSDHKQRDQLGRCHVRACAHSRYLADPFVAPTPLHALHFVIRYRRVRNSVTRTGRCELLVPQRTIPVSFPGSPTTTRRCSNAWRWRAPSSNCARDGFERDRGQGFVIPVVFHIIHDNRNGEHQR